VLTPPDTRYAHRDGAHLAYQVAGSGPRTLIYAAGSTSTSVAWELAASRSTLSRLASFSRLITFDERGAGSSDPLDLSALPSLEDRVADLEAVVKFSVKDGGDDGEPPWLFGTHDGGAVAILYALRNPVAALVLCNTWARLEEAEDYPIGVSSAAMDRAQDRYRDQWGSGHISPAHHAGRRVDNAEVDRRWARHEQEVTSPTQAVAMFEMSRAIDIRDRLAGIDVPTLVIHTVDNRTVPIGIGRYLADHIPTATFVELPGTYHAFWVDHADPVLHLTEEFLTGGHQEVDPDRATVTVMFTDIVGSTELAVRLGDREWRTLHDAHDRAVRDEVLRYGGRVIKGTGDGFLVAFDEPNPAVACATQIQQRMLALPLGVRIGLHVGDVYLDGDDLLGLTVNVAERIKSLGGATETVVSSTTLERLTGPWPFDAGRSVALRGIPGEVVVHTMRTMGEPRLRGS
jgi:class 3 adenylate cyclase